MKLHNVHDVDGLQRDRYWYDQILEASHWFSLSDIEPAHAAMLLCELNPNELDYLEAERTTNEETGPRELVQLKQRFTDLSKNAPRARTLLDWLPLEIHANDARADINTLPAGHGALVSYGELRSSVGGNCSLREHAAAAAGVGGVSRSTAPRRRSGLAMQSQPWTGPSPTLPRQVSIFFTPPQKPALY